MKCCLSDVKRGSVVVVEIEDGVVGFAQEQGVVLGAKIEVLKKCKHYVLFYLRGSLCAIDIASANKIWVEV